MINSLSILIPTYNNVCLELVRDLQAQASILSSTNDLEYEILVADDGLGNPESSFHTPG